MEPKVGEITSVWNRTCTQTHKHTYTVTYSITQVIVHATLIMLVVSSCCCCCCCYRWWWWWWSYCFLLLYCSPGYVFIARMAHRIQINRNNWSLSHPLALYALCGCHIYNDFFPLHTQTHNYRTTSSLVHVPIRFGHAVCFTFKNVINVYAEHTEHSDRSINLRVSNITLCCARVCLNDFQHTSFTTSIRGAHKIMHNCGLEIWIALISRMITIELFVVPKLFHVVQTGICHFSVIVITVAFFQRFIINKAPWLGVKPNNYQLMD